MNNVIGLLRQDVWRVIDQSSLGPLFHPLQSFALDDTFCELVGTGKSPAVARAWVHTDAVILGIADSRLPYIDEGVNWLKQQGYQVIVRTSGGLAVLLDEGVLNLTLVIPERERSIDINRGYDAMYELIKLMFQDVTDRIEAREIVGSYCPGSYDLSIDGRKFAGISQRRVKKGVAVQIYLCINGSGSQRAEVIREFYERAKKGEATKFTYPHVNPQVMASLEELLGTPLTIRDTMFRFLKVLQKLSRERLYNSELLPQERLLYEHYLERVMERNSKWLDY